MKRLIERGLMFGNLFRVDSPALIGRYNRALEHLTGKQTALSDFHIDISGYSPEIGDELDDHLYLNHEGVNRQFILLTPEQKTCPLLNAKFSTSRGILRKFIDENEAQLFALTAADAVAGEMVNSVYTLSEPRRLLDLRQIRVEADTTRGTLRHADRLAEKIERFRKEDDAWHDDALIAEMIELAGLSGDLTRNPIRLKHTEFHQNNFWTSHFGGLYLFPRVEHPAAIACTDRNVLDGTPIKYRFDLGDRNRIAKFLSYNELVEPIVKARGIDGAAVLRQKMDFITIDAAASAGFDLRGLTRTDMRRLARQIGDRMPDAFHGLAALANWAEQGGKWPRISSEHEAYFYTLRAANTPERDLVNMLLAELAPKDFRQLFICHKQAFYKRYAGWPDAQKTYVAEFLAREYQIDKAGARAALFGHEPDMDNHRPPRDMISRVGPWGAVRRR